MTNVYAHRRRLCYPLLTGFIRRRVLFVRRHALSGGRGVAMKIIVLLVVLCAGCADQVRYEAGSSSMGLAGDKFYCEREIRSVTDLAKQEVAMQTCMQGKGWVVKRD